MKILYGLLLLSWTALTFTDWTLGSVTIGKGCDLIIDGAWRESMKGKPRALSVLTKQFVTTLSAGRSSTVVDYHITSQGLALHGHDRKNHQVDIFLDGQPTHSIEWSRKKTKHIAQFPKGCLVSDGPFCARVMVKDRANGKLLAPAMAVAHEVGAIFNLKIDGTAGSYTVTLLQA